MSHYSGVCIERAQTSHLDHCVAILVCFAVSPASCLISFGRVYIGSPSIAAAFHFGSTHLPLEVGQQVLHCMRSVGA